jgi:hypothetical protein
VISVGALTPILVCFHKLEITPPSNFNHSRDGTLHDRRLWNHLLVATGQQCGDNGFVDKHHLPGR